MGTIRSGVVISLGVLLTLLVGCASDPAGDGAGSESAAPTSEAPTMDQQAVSEPAMPEPVAPKRPETRMGELWVPEAVTRSGSSEADMVMVESKFYFDFDQAIVKRAGHDALARHAEFLAANPGSSVRLEGHADERGTREYNLALGERRANAVSAYLRARGASAGQVEVISYGEEKPAALGHDEASWSRNRRVELVYK